MAGVTDRQLQRYLKDLAKKEAAEAVRLQRKESRAKAAAAGASPPKPRLAVEDWESDELAELPARAKDAGVAGRIRFSVASATDFPGGDYALITFFDCLHDLPDPVGALTHSHAALAPGGAVLIVEPMATEDVAGNLNPVGRIYSAASVFVCMPNAIAGGGTPLGTLASERSLREVASAAGFRHFRRVTETPFNRIFEAKP